MNEIVCTGLDGANPLHVLATFGLLHLSDRIVPGTALSWRRSNGAWRPVLHITSNTKEHLDSIAAWLIALGKTGSADPALAKGIGREKATLKKLRQDNKDRSRAAKAEAKAAKLIGADAAALVADQTNAITVEICQREKVLEDLQGRLATALGVGIAHLGDIIGTKAEVVRQVNQAATMACRQLSSEIAPCPDDSILVAAHAAALACDQVTDDGKVVPTPYSFGNGSSGQNLLKDFRSIATAITLAQVQGTLLGTDARWVKDGTALNWDPLDQRSYALTWEDPATSGKLVNAAANALAYVGLALLPAMPIGKSLGAVAWGDYDGWTWPIWESMLSVSVVRSLLAHTDLQAERPNAQAWCHRGVIEIRRCCRINPTGKRSFFAPSRPV